jgi:hypothetical protein
MIVMVGFATWREVLDHVASGAKVYYHAPLSCRPVLVHCTVSGPKSRVVRVHASETDREADNFSADSKHLDRFKQAIVSTPV